MNPPTTPLPKAVGTGYDVFVSYAHADRDFAVRLQKALQAYRAPLFSGLSPRRLRVFRDESDAAENRLTEGITRALEDSRKLLVLCSPASRDRPWVNDEVSQFAQHNGATHIVPVLVAGCPNIEAEQKRTPEDAAFPAAVIQTLGSQPWAPDFRSVSRSGTRVTYDRAAWFHLLASLYQTTREIIEKRERTRVLTRTALGTTLALAIGFSVYEYSNLRRARESTALADAANRLGKQSTKIEEALRTAKRAVATAQTTEATAALRDAIGKRLDAIRTSAGNRDNSSTIVIDANGETVVIMSPFGRVRMWRASGEELSRPCGYFGPLSSITLSPDGQSLAWFDHGRSTLGIWQIRLGMLVEAHSGVSPFEGGRIEFAPSSKVVAFLPQTPNPVRPSPVTPSLWRVVDGKHIASLSKWAPYPQVTFSSDGALLVQYAIGSPLVAVRQTGDGAMRNDLGDIGEAVVFARFSADSRKLLALSRTARPERYRILLAGTDSGPPRRFDAGVFDLKELRDLEPGVWDQERFSLGEVFAERLRGMHRASVGDDKHPQLSFAKQNAIAVYKGNRPTPSAFVFDSVTLKIGAMLAPVQRASHLALSADGRFVVEQEQGPIWDTATGRKLWQLPSSVRGLMFSADGSRLFARNRSLSDSRVVVYDVRTGTQIAQLPDVHDSSANRRENEVALLHVDRAGRRALVVSDHSVFVWTPDAGDTKQLEGSYKMDSEQFEADSMALQQTVQPSALMAIASRWLPDCPR